MLDVKPKLCHTGAYFPFSFHQKQIQRPAPPPGKFFPSHSYVVDYHFGELLPVIKLLQDEELIFVMYYAPWCAESLRVRGEFIRAAKVIGDAVSVDFVNFLSLGF